MKTQLTRRELAASLPAILAAPAASAERGAAQAETLESARKRLRESISKLGEFDLPMVVEPAFIFKP
jgi:hypothetical protein